MPSPPFTPGTKAALRPIHDKVMRDVAKFGDVEIAPQETYVSLRRKNEFAMIRAGDEHARRSRVPPKGRRRERKARGDAPGCMCSHVVKLASVDDANAELSGWLRAAYDAAG